MVSQNQQVSDTTVIFRGNTAQQSEDAQQTAVFCFFLVLVVCNFCGTVDVSKKSHINPQCLIPQQEWIHSNTKAAGRPHYHTVLQTTVTLWLFGGVGSGSVI